MPRGQRLATSPVAVDQQHHAALRFHERTPCECPAPACLKDQTRLPVPRFARPARDVARAVLVVRSTEVTTCASEGPVYRAIGALPRRGASFRCVSEAALRPG